MGLGVEHQLVGLGLGVGHGPLGEALGLVDDLAGLGFAVPPALVGGLLGVLGPGVGHRGPLLGLGHQLLRGGDGDVVAFALLALRTLAALGQLELERLQLGLALLLGLGEQLGGGGSLLLGLAGRHVAQLDDLALGGGAERGDLALGGGPVLGDLVVGDAAELAGLPFGLRPQGVGLPFGRRPPFVRLALGRVAGGLGFAFGGGLDRGGHGPGLLDHLLGLEVGGGDQLLGLALGFVAVLVGLLLGQPQELLDPRAQPGQRGLGRLVELLGLVGDFAFELVDAIPGVGGAGLGLGGGVGQLFDAGLEPLDEHVDLRAFVTPEDDGEVRGAGAVGRRRSGGPHEDSS